jgi:hypothetical protein
MLGDVEHEPVGVLTAYELSILKLAWLRGLLRQLSRTESRAPSNAREARTAANSWTWSEPSRHVNRQAVRSGPRGARSASRRPAARSRQVIRARGGVDRSRRP